MYLIFVTITFHVQIQECLYVAMKQNQDCVQERI
jgi:hypothetical protein